MSELAIVGLVALGSLIGAVLGNLIASRLGLQQRWEKRIRDANEKRRTELEQKIEYWRSRLGE